MVGNNKKKYRYVRTCQDSQDTRTVACCRPHSTGMAVAALCLRPAASPSWRLASMRSSRKPALGPLAFLPRSTPVLESLLSLGLLRSALLCHRYSAIEEFSMFCHDPFIPATGP